MLKNMELWTKIRHALFVEGMSKRKAARHFKVAYHTIDKISRNESPGDYVRTQAPTTKLTPFIPFIEAYLAEDKTLPRKQRHSKKRIYERLCKEHGYTHSYRAVCEQIGKLREKEKKLFIPLAHPHGQAQFDFGFAEAIIDGVQQKVAYAAMSLPYSNVRYVQAFPRECTETFQEALKRFFQFLGGVPTLIKFDNGKVQVAKIYQLRGQTPTEGLSQLMSAYFFQHHFCRIYQPQEKGHVESAVKYVRKNFMVPLPQFPTFAAFNEYLEQKCREEFSKTSAMKDKTIGELFVEEQSSLLPLPKTDFEARRMEVRRANSLSLVRFDRNDYSVPSEHAHKEFTVSGSIDTVTFTVESNIVALYERDWGKKKTYYNPIHYLAIASKRPNSLDFGAPFAEWQLPASFDVLRRRLEMQAGKQGKREYIRILRLLEKYTLNELARGIERALAHGTTAYEGIRLYVENEATVPVELFSLDGRPMLQQVSLPEPDINIYSTLLERNSDEETRNETDRAFEASFTAVETTGLRTGMRGDSISMCEGKCRSSGLLAPTFGAGTFGSGGKSSGTPIEVSEVPQFEDIGKLRLQSTAESEQDAGDSVDAWRIHRESGVDHSDWTAWHGQDASCNGTGHSSVSDGQEGEVLSGERLDYSTLGSERRETADSDEEESFDVGRGGLG
jgi:transposase